MIDDERTLGRWIVEAFNIRIQNDLRELIFAVTRAEFTT